MSLSNMRIQDPILTQLAQGYHNNTLVSELLMPVVEIEKEAGKIPQFGTLAFRVHSTVRELHGDSNRLTPEDIGSIGVELQEHDVEYPIDYREENDASYPLKRYALSVVQGVIALGRELEVASIAQDPDNYLPSNKLVLPEDGKFSNTKVSPLGVFNSAKNTISGVIGRDPNVCVIAHDVWEVLKENEVLLDRIKYTRVGILTPETFAELIGIDVVKIGAASQEKNGVLERI